MKMTFLAIAAAAAVITVLPLTARAQEGWYVREQGPVGAAIDAAEAILGVEERPRFREYVIREHRPSYRFQEELHVGAVLPDRGVTLYEVPREYHVRPGYRYAVVNDVPVIVEPRSRRIVEIVE